MKSYNGAIDAFDYLEATPFAGATLTFTLSKSSMDSSLVKLSYSAVWSSCRSLIWNVVVSFAYAYVDENDKTKAKVKKQERSFFILAWFCSKSSITVWLQWTR